MSYAYLCPEIWYLSEHDQLSSTDLAKTVVFERIIGVAKWIAEYCHIVLRDGKAKGVYTHNCVIRSNQLHFSFRILLSLLIVCLLPLLPTAFYVLVEKVNTVHESLN